jgi:signal transduction histidine kinase
MAAHHYPPQRGACRIVPARLGVIALAILYCVAWSQATADEQRRRIYFLESLAPSQPAATRTIEAFKRRLGERTSESFDIFIDYMELGRFPGQAHIDRTVRFLQEKYAEAPPAVLIPLGRAAVPFMLQYRKIIAPDAPVIMTSVPAQATSEASGLDNAVWVVTEYDFAKTLEFARRLQPKARQIVVIAGTSDYDRLWLDDARRDLEPYRDRYEIRYLTDLPYDELLTQVSHLPADAIVMMSFVFRDGAGLPRTPPDVAAAVSSVSPAPVYAPISTYFSRGIVGGYMDSYEAHGVAAADLALEILSGKSTAGLDRFTRPLHQYHADARQLDHWGLSAKALPADTVVAFRQPSVWDEHRGLVVAAALAFVLQTGLVVALLIHRRRRQLAERRLVESEERLLVTAAAANVGLWQLDPKTNELWMTEHCRELFGLSSSAPPTRASLITLIHPEDRDIAVSLLQAADGADRRSLGDVRILAPDGTARWIRIRTRLDPGDRSAPKQLRGLVADITDLKAAESEAALRRDEVAHLKRIREREGRLMTMNAMSASIAHEISQPIGAMMASADAALVWLDKTPPALDSVRTSVEHIAEDGRRASQVIASVRALFRRDGGGTELIDINGLIAEILAIEHDELQRHAIAIVAELATTAMVSFDRGQLQQVVLNLVTNAMEAMIPVTDRPRVLRVRTGLDGSGEVLIAVEDSGVGIDRADLGRIFEPLFTTKSRGMGLGLWLCRRIVENHHGRLTASSVLDRGSRFEIALPNANVRTASPAAAWHGGEDG